MHVTRGYVSRVQEYEKALKYVRGLLQTEPQNNQAKELERLIDKAMKKGDRLARVKSSFFPGAPWNVHKGAPPSSHS